MKKVIVLSKDGCSGCAAFAMLMKTDANLQEQNIVIYKKDENSEYDELVVEHKVKSLPSFIYINSSNIEIKSGFSFAADKKKLNDFFSEQ